MRIFDTQPGRRGLGGELDVEDEFVVAVRSDGEAEYRFHERERRFYLLAGHGPA
ncbi:hypothetical protein V6V89_19890 [Micromonospora sp. CPCC 206061]